jgi:hypothetical protein
VKGTAAMNDAVELLRTERAIAAALARDPERDLVTLERRRAELYLKVYADEAERARYAELIAKGPTR